MDQEVAKTLGELELKLQELERELSSIGHRDGPSQPGDRRPPSVPPDTAVDTPSRPPIAGGRLIDEAVEQADGVAGRAWNPQDEAEAQARETAADNAFGGPAVWGGEEVPAQPGATIESGWTTDVRETAYGEIPTPPPPSDASSSPPNPAWPSPQEPPLPPPPPQPPLAQPHHPYAATPPEREAIDVADLVRFKEKLRQTMDELIDEYSRLLSRRPPS